MKRVLLKETEFGQTVIPYAKYDPVLSKVKNLCGVNPNLVFSNLSIKKSGANTQESASPNDAATTIALYRYDDAKKRHIYIYYSRKENKLKMLHLDENNKLIQGYPKDFTQCMNTIGLSPEQTEIIDKEVELNPGKMQREFPGAAAIAGKEWVPVDLNTNYPDYFPTPGVHYIFKAGGMRTGEAGAREVIQPYLDQAGWTLIKPNDPLLMRTGKSLDQAIDPDLAKTYLQQSGLKKYPMVYRKSQEGILGTTTEARKECRTIIKTLYAAAKEKNPERVVKILQGQNPQTLIEKAIQCQEDKVFLGKNVFGLGIGDEYDFLSKNYGPYGLARYLKKTVQEESHLRLKKLIRENLEEMIEIKKKSTIQEETIIRGRLKTILETKNIRTKKQLNETIDKMFNEFHYLHKQGYNKKLINEAGEGLIGMLTGILGGGPGKWFVESIKERFVSWLETQLGIDPNGFIASAISIGFGNLQLSDVPKLFECDFLTHFITKSIAETGIKKLQQAQGFDSMISDVVRNAIVDSLDKTELAQKMIGGVESIICPKISGLKDKMGDVAANMKKGALQMT